MDMIAKTYIIKGRVQGVGFRYFVFRKAVSLGIKGYVKNLSNGDVEVIAEGSKNNMDEFEKFLWRGPSLSKVIDIKTDNIPVKNYPSFEIKY